MKKLIKEFCLFVVISVAVGICIYLLTHSIWLSIAITVLLIIAASIKPTFKILSFLFRKSEKYQIYFDFLKFKKDIPQHLKIVNLGSSSGKFAFGYDGLINGANWALAPQTLAYDFNILKQYHTYIKPGGVVLISLCPFSGCVAVPPPTKEDVKYYAFLHPAMIYGYSSKIAKTITTNTHNLIYIGIKQLGLISYCRAAAASILKTHASLFETNILSNNDVEKDAEHWISSWKNQFSIEDLEEKAISSENKKAIDFNTTLLSDIIQFCKDRDLRPVIVLPPVTKALSSKISKECRSLYLYPLLNSDNAKTVPLLNYLDNDRFTDNSLYFNAFFLNARGKRLFTEQVINDIQKTTII